MKRAAALVLSVFVGLVLGEFIVRVREEAGFRGAWKSIWEKDGVPESYGGKNEWLVPDPDLSFTYNPNLPYVNSLGIQAPEIPPKDPAGPMRIIVIGDSVAAQSLKQEFLKFLRKIDRETPPALELHLIVDNYSTHKHEQVKKWLAKHPRFHFHFIPTSSSWLNLVERWFRELTQKRIRRGVFRSVPELEAAIHEYLEASNQAPKPFVWTAPAQDILAKVERAAKTHAIVQNR